MKIAQALAEISAMARCTHKFRYIRDTHNEGVVGRCLSTCKCRVTAWPGTHHYKEIAAARERQSERGG